LYDKIIVSAASKELPQELILQLQVGGVLVIPVENTILKITKISLKETVAERHYGFVFVPLIR
jgi:protein-L-isoaspartate(D-aspartate) O-methyltransferase